MIGVKTLVDCVNACASTVTNPLNILQLTSVSKDFNTGFVMSVANVAALPSAADNKGRFIYIQDTGVYRYSDGVQWSNNFTSTQQNFETWTWGCNEQGQLGDGTTVSKRSPVSVVGGFTDWCQVSTSLCHNLAIRTNGTAWAWGGNGSGRLGDNTLVNKSSPVSVVGGFTDWIQVSAGGCHSLGVRANGTAWAWGNSATGRLGDNQSALNALSPVSVVGGFTDWIQVGAGLCHSIGLRSNGTIWAWGNNNIGQLGDNTTVNSSSPVSVVGGFTDWCYISNTSGSQHGLGIRTNGTLWSWGGNGSGQLGDGTAVNKSSPVSVVGGFTDWCQVSAGYNVSLGVRTNGTAWAWGNNTLGRLGDGTVVTKSSPVSIIGGFTDWCQVSVGDGFGLGVRTNGTAWAWGSNTSGRLGDGTITNMSSPVSVIGGFTDWYEVSAGGSSLALRSTKGF